MAINSRIVTSVTDFISVLEPPADATDVWYRGQANTAWKLTPSLARHPDATLQERNLMKRFQQSTRPLLPIVPEGKETWEWLFLMQHHRVHTRLLDWTESPLVALYFAVHDDAPENDTWDGAVWQLDPHQLNRHANQNFRDDPTELPAFGVDSKLDNYMPERIEAAANMKPIAAIGPRTSSRMSAQLGTFTITHKDHTPIEDVADASHIMKYEIPAANKSEIRRVLDILQYNRLRLFPDLDAAAAIAMKVRPS